MRLPALAGAALYFAACYQLARFAFGDSFSMLLALLLLSLNPLVLDFMVAARGYGQALGLLMFAMAICSAKFHARPIRRKHGGGRSALGISSDSQPGIRTPCGRPGGVTLYFVTRHRPRSCRGADAPGPAREKKAPVIKPSKPGYRPYWHSLFQSLPSPSCS